jgi:hypothetical protein
LLCKLQPACRPPSSFRLVIDSSNDFSPSMPEYACRAFC